MDMNLLIPANHNTQSRLALAVAGLDPAMAASMQATFGDFFAQAEEWAARAKAIQVTSANQVEAIKFARESRLALRQIRLRVENRRKELKEDSLKRGRAIDGVANSLKSLIEPIEAQLLEQEEFVERQEAARVAAIRQKRTEELLALGASPSIYADLGNMPDPEWENLRQYETQRHESQLAQERAAEEVREKGQQERAEAEAKMLAENARLKKEADELEKARGAERAKREAAEKELRKLRAVEGARVEQEREAEKAPDREKLKLFAAKLRSLEVPTMKTKFGKATAGYLAKELSGLAAWAEATADSWGKP
jgi:hypothetical protein